MFAAPDTVDTTNDDLLINRIPIAKITFWSIGTIAVIAVIGYFGTREDSPGRTTAEADPIGTQLRKDVEDLGDLPITQDETVRIEEVLLFYERFAGEKLAFWICAVDQEIHRASSGEYRLDVTSRDSTYVSHFGDIRFVIPVEMAEVMAPKLKGNSEWPNCTILCRALDGGAMFVIGIDVYNRGGEVSTMFRVPVRW